MFTPLVVIAAPYDLFKFRTDASSLDNALKTVASKAGIQLIYKPELVAGKEVQPLNGVYTVSQALEFLLRGSGLSYKFVAADSAVVVPGNNLPEPAVNKEAANNENEKDTSTHGVLEEVIVSSQRRSERLQDTPLAVTVFTAGEIRSNLFRRSDDIARLAPNLQWKTIGAATGGNIFLRGVGDNNFGINQVGAVGIYVDEVPLNSPTVNTFGVLDLERIEVVRGPQNTLYGRNTTGGAINYISRQPVLAGKPSTDLEIVYGRYDQLEVEAATGFSIGERAAARIALRSQQRGEINNNLFLGRRENEIDKEAGRAQVLLQLGDNVELLVNLHGGTNRGANRRWKSLGLLNAETGAACATALARNLGSGCVDLLGFADTKALREVFAGDANSREQLDAWGGLVRLDAEYSDFTFTSISAFETNRIERNEDGDAGPRPLFAFYQQADVEQWTQELRVASAAGGRFNWIGGMLLFSESLEVSTATPVSTSGAQLAADFGTATIASQDNDVWSLYAQGTFDLSGALALSLGLRYTVENKQGVIEPFEIDPALIEAMSFIGEAQVRSAAISEFQSIIFDETWEAWGARAALDYRFSEQLMVYASISHGFKGGGVNISPQQVVFGFEDVIVDPEFLTAYELGMKSAWANERLIFNAALFYSQYDDQQVFQVVGGNPVLANAARSSILGLEAELRWIPVAGWLVNAGLGMLNAEFREFDAGMLQDLKGNKLVSAPEYSVHLSVEKRWPFAGGLLSVQPNISLVDDQFFSVLNDPVAREDGYYTLDLNISYRMDTVNEYRVSLWGKNITDQTYCTDRVDVSSFGFFQCAPGEPRTYGVSLSARF